MSTTTDSTTVSLGTDTESMEIEDVTQDVTVSISKSRLRDLFKGLFWIKSLLIQAGPGLYGSAPSLAYGKVHPALHRNGD